MPHTKSFEGPSVILLDAGNTLVFLDFGTVGAIAKSVGIECTEEQLLRHEALAKRRYENSLVLGGTHDSGWDLYFIALFECVGIEPSVTKASLLPLLKAEHDRFNLWRLVPEGLAEALFAYKAKGRRFAVVSNSEGQLPQLFDRVGLGGLFELIVDSAIEGVRKPDPEIFERTLERLNVSRDQCVYLGDIPGVDIVGAAAAGINGVLIDQYDLFPDFDGRKFRSVVQYLHTLS